MVISRMSKPLLLTSLILSTLTGVTAGAENPHSRPNVLLIVVDDLGYSDIGAFGGEIDTPNLDALVRKGRHLDSMYVAPTCSPTRSMLMSGMDHHLAGLGNMAELMNPVLTPEHMGAPGYEGWLSERVAALPELMQAAGYRTLMAGKWHLGARDGYRPEQRGFDHAWALMDGGAAHFNQSAPQSISAGAPAPTYLENGHPIGLPDDFYSSRAYTDQLIRYLEQTAHTGQPFFTYAAYTAPHWPIQAPDEYLAKHRGRYDAGYDAIAAARLVRMKTYGLIADDTPLPLMPDGVKPWAELSASERAYSARIMETYAATVDALDHEIGRLLDYLERSGQLDNTLIVFLSDNGPEGNDLSQSAGNAEWIQAHFDQSLDNLGRRNSFVFQGPAWGQVSATPLRWFKAYTYEGGIRSAAFMVFPNRIGPGRSGNPVTARDIMPTILDAAGIKHPGIRWSERNVLPMQGMSLLPWLEGRTNMPHTPDTALGFELMGRSALRKDEWKIVYHYQEEQGRWQLYNLHEDPSEQRDLSNLHTDKLDELLIEWAHYIQHNNVIWTGRDTAYPRSKH